MKSLELIRIIAHHIGLAITTIGMLWLIFIMCSYPSLSSNATMKISAIIYLGLYPIFVALILIEDIIFIGRHKGWIKF